MSDEPMAYIARKPCGCFVWAGVDMPSMAKSIAENITWAVQEGYPIERVTVAFVRENWRTSCEACKPPQQASFS